MGSFSTITIARDYQIVNGYVQLPPNLESGRNLVTVAEALALYPGSTVVTMSLGSGADTGAGFGAQSFLRLPAVAAGVDTTPPSPPPATSSGTDIIVANSGALFHTGISVGILLNNGDGTFQGQIPLNAKGSPYALAVADLNGDGISDIVTTNYAELVLGPATASILLSNGTGSFHVATTFSTLLQPYSVALGDLNGDGKPDLVIGGYTGGNAGIVVLLGNGNGTFRAGVTYNLGAYSRLNNIIIADLNGDGKADLVCHSSGEPTSTLLGNGNGTFQAPTHNSVNIGQSWRIAVGDLNGDGKPDLVATSRAVGSPLNFVTVQLGNGNGTFRAPTTFATGPGNPGPFAVAIGDLNGDGKADLAVTNYASNNVAVLAGNGNGTFQAARSFATGSGPNRVLIADLNGDGKNDLAVLNYNGGYAGSVSVLFGNGNGTFQAKTDFVTGQASFDIALAAGLEPSTPSGFVIVTP